MARTLSGRSHIVSNDPYELRIVVPTTPNTWRAQSIRVSAEDIQAGVKAEFKQAGAELRATIASPASREVRWSVRFARGRGEPSPVAP